MMIIGAKEIGRGGGGMVGPIFGSLALWGKGVFLSSFPSCVSIRYYKNLYYSRSIR